MRLDLYLVNRGDFASRHRAQNEIKAGSVKVNGTLTMKPSFKVSDEDVVTLSTLNNPYVSQGGLKLEAALQAFSTNMEGRSVLDIGSSTGGFTDCAFRHGAREVYAVDVGTLQMHGVLRSKKTLHLYEQTNFLDTTPEQFSNAIDLVVMDVSFTSSIPLIHHAWQMFGEIEMIVLVKPQFENTERSKKGVIRHPRVHERILTHYLSQLEMLGIPHTAMMASPIKGQHGNKEFLLHINREDKPLNIKTIVSKAHKGQ
ncbi:MAG: TlyA family RNA methyltransferase [Bacillota bacterium]